MNTEERDTVITLIDDTSGEEVDFDLLLTFDYEGKRYVALQPLDDVDGVEEDEVVLLELVKDSEGDSFKSIDNEILLDEVFKEFQELFDELGEDE